MEKSIRIAQILGDKQEYYLGHSCKTIDKSLLYTPGPDVIEKVWMNSDRNLPTLNNMRRLLIGKIRQYRICIHFAGRSGGRTHGRGFFRS